MLSRIQTIWLPSLFCLLASCGQTTLRVRLTASPSAHASRHVETLVDSTTGAEIQNDDQPGQRVTTDDNSPVNRSESPGRLTLSAGKSHGHEHGIVLTQAPDGTYFVGCLNPFEPIPQLTIADKRYHLAVLLEADDIHAIDRALREQRLRTPQTRDVVLKCSDSYSRRASSMLTGSHVYLESRFSVALELTSSELVEVRHRNTVPLARFAFGGLAAVAGVLAVGGAIAWAASNDTRAGKLMTLVAAPLFAAFTTTTILWPPVDIYAGGSR